MQFFIILCVCILSMFNLVALTKIISSFFAVLIYLINLVESLNNNKKFKDTIIKLIVAFNVLMAVFSFYLDIKPIYAGIFLTTSLLSTILLINKNIFNFFVKKLNMNIQWGKITHRTFFPLSLYILLNPIVYLTTMGAHLMISLSSFFQIIDQLGFQILLFAYSFIGVGFGTRRGLKDCINRLSIGIPNIKYAIVGFVGIYLIDYIIWNVPLFIDNLISLIVPNLGSDIATKMAVESSNVEQVVESIKHITPSITEVAFLSIVVGISEELLFRGALQPRFGNLYTSLLFTVLHFQYFSIVALLDIFLISYMLGMIRNKTNTSTTALIHTIYDFISLGGLVFLFNV